MNTLRARYLHPGHRPCSLAVFEVEEVCPDPHSDVMSSHGVRLRVEGLDAAITRLTADLRTNPTVSVLRAPPGPRGRPRYIDHEIITVTGPMRPIRDVVRRHQNHRPDVLTVEILP